MGLGQLWGRASPRSWPPRPRRCVVLALAGALLPLAAWCDVWLGCTDPWDGVGAMGGDSGTRGMLLGGRTPCPGSMGSISCGDGCGTGPQGVCGGGSVRLQLVTCIGQCLQQHCTERQDHQQHQHQHRSLSEPLAQQGHVSPCTTPPGATGGGHNWPLRSGTGWCFGSHQAMVAGVSNSKSQRGLKLSSQCCGPARGMLLVGSIHPAPWWLLCAGKLLGDVWVKVPSGCWGGPAGIPCPRPAAATALTSPSLPCHSSTAPLPGSPRLLPLPSSRRRAGGATGHQAVLSEGCRQRPKGFSSPQGAGGGAGKTSSISCARCTSWAGSAAAAGMEPGVAHPSQPSRRKRQKEVTKDARRSRQKAG